MVRRSIRKTIVFKGIQHYAVFENYPFNKNKGNDYAVRKRISANFVSKEKARDYMRRNP